MDYRNNCGCGNTVRNVKCDAKQCVYHSEDDDCHAGAIKVANEAAKDKSETFCATYERK